MAKEIRYRSYCWAVGTTSYRTDQFNLNIERQLELMNEFRSLKKNRGKTWKGNQAFQMEYYDFLKQKQFVKGDAPRPDKDAREKTSGLKDIGLLDEERNLTEAGMALLKIARSRDFTIDNLLEIPRDSFIYLKQMFKACNEVEGNKVRPFAVFLYVVSKTEYLTYQEFTYLLPLCVDLETTERMIRQISLLRKGDVHYEDIIVSVLMNMNNYKEALRLLRSETVSEDLICTIGINRKSAAYDKPYYSIYKILKGIVLEGKELAQELYDATKKLTNTKVGGAWRKYLFCSTSKKVIKREGTAVLHAVPVLASRNEMELKEEFFRLMHLFKAKATLSDYFDLNRRYFKATDTVLFQDGRVTLDTVPKCYADSIADHLIEFAFQDTELLTKDVALEEIDPCLKLDQDLIYEKLGRLLGKKVTDKESAKRMVRKERYQRFDKLMDEKFTKDRLIELFTCFENRNDEEIHRLVTDNADIPTIFEYILGISWYLISGRAGDVLEYMNLSLEADLLPKTHAGGGEADIVWRYDGTEWYPKHTLLIEATLADGSNQRRMEMEPVSRHLGEYCLANPGEEAYCVFATTYLHRNVISDFRGRKFMEYYNRTGTEYIAGMKILPLQTAELKTMLESGMKYRELYQILDQAYQSAGSSAEWYENHIAKQCI